MHRNKIMIKNKIVGDTQIPPPLPHDNKSQKMARLQGKVYPYHWKDIVRRKAFVNYQTSSITVHKVPTWLKLRYNKRKKEKTSSHDKRIKDVGSPYL